jgi:hypothetical protein
MVDRDDISALVKRRQCWLAHEMEGKETEGQWKLGGLNDCFGNESGLIA